MAQTVCLCSVPQGNKLMTGTVREAVAFADKSRMHDDEKIEQALKVACAYEFVSELENGVDTLLGERGTGLSEGQTQRIAVARAVFSDSPVLILDEATSSLDSATEKKLLKNLRKMTDKTVIIVTHRPAALEICDRVRSHAVMGMWVSQISKIHFPPFDCGKSGKPQDISVSIVVENLLYAF